MQSNPLLVWEPTPDAPLPNLETVNTDGRASEYKEFLRYVSQKTGNCTFEQLAILYPAICQSAMEWLLVQRKSVDFGFAIIHPRCHRANWRSILLATFPRLGPSLLGKSRVIKEAILTACGFFTKLLDTKLLAIARDRYVVWGLDIELKRSWYRAMFRNESHIHSKLGSVEYASYIARQAVRLRPKMLSTYLAELRQISYPAAMVRRSRSYSRPFIVPFVPKGKVQAVVDNSYEVAVVVPREPEEVVPNEPQNMESPNETLLGLPNLRSESEDLRVSRIK